MKALKLRLLTCGLVLLATNSVFSQPGRTEKRVTDASGGYSYLVPSSFKAQQGNDGSTLVNTAQTIFIIAKSHEFQTFEKFMAQSNLEEDGATLVGNVQDVGGKGKHFRVSKQTPQGLAIIDTFVLFSPFGGGTLVVAISATADQKENFDTGLQVANSVAFIKPETGGVENQWQTFLRGKRLSYVYNGNNYGEITHIHLCPSGKFLFSVEIVTLSPTNSDGSWKISARGGAKLILEFRDGTRSEREVSRGESDDVIVLNGKKFRVEASDKCP